MPQRLQNPPLVEAVCEFRFPLENRWDWTIPGRLYERIWKDFPEKREVHQYELQLHVASQGASSSISQPIPQGIQFWTAHREAMIYVGPSFLSVHRFSPYPGWNGFQKLILSVVESYLEVVEAPNLQSVGLRFINHIDLPEGNIEIGDYITLDPPLKGELDLPLEEFYQRYQLAIREDPPLGSLLLQVGTKWISQRRKIVLDLNFLSYDLEKTAFRQKETLQQWLEKAHKKVYTYFKACLSEKLFRKYERGK